MEISWLVSVIIFILSLFSILKLLTTKSPPMKLPPGPPKLPMIGNNLHQLASKATPPHHRLHELARAYGPIMHLRLGEVPTVVISSADVAREVMRTHDADLANRPKLMVRRELYYDYSHIIALAPYGEYWRQVRKIATLELSTVKRVQSFRPIREEERAHLIESIASEAAHGAAVNISDKLFGLSFNITTR